MLVSVGGKALSERLKIGGSQTQPKKEETAGGSLWGNEHLEQRSEQNHLRLAPTVAAYSPS